MATGALQTATFLFTDIEGSTQLWEQHPDAMREALARHDALLRAAVEQHAGRVIKTTGDGLHAAFDSVGPALQAVLAGQQALRAEAWGVTGPLRVRMAVHIGEAEARAGDFYGPALNRAVRLMAASHGGQILLSEVAATLGRDRLPAGASLRDLGQHRLKDLIEPEHVFQLAHPTLPEAFPPLRSLAAFPHNLPVQVTRFIGREREIVEVRARLGESRLLTLTGPGGTGKTRLSLQVAAEVLEQFGEGVWLVELAPLADPTLLPQAVAGALGVREQAGRPLRDALVDYLRYKDLLLILDNCEHLIEACARLADHLLRACPKLKILASSREVLGIAGEAAYRVPSLALPAGAHPDLAELSQSEAAQLFLDRAQAVRPGFSLNIANAAAVGQICARLDGIPLALELAAARVMALSVEQIAARLVDRFRLLTGGSRAALPRQQTLRALIDWSWDLLAEPERVLLRRLSAFAGGWTLEAAEAVCSDQAAVSRESRQPNTAHGLLLTEHVLDLLTHLIHKSLVIVEHHAGQAPRYRLLETIRQYARDKLLEAGEAEAVRERHLAFFRALVAAAEPRLQGSDMAAGLDDLEREQDNLRTALEWALERQPLAALEMVAVLYIFFGRRASNTEGRNWARAALTRAEGEIARPFLLARARCLAGESALAFGQGESAVSRAAAEASLALARQLGDLRTAAMALGMGAMAAGMLDDQATALRWGQEALLIARQHGFTYELGIGGSSLALIAILAGDVALAQQLLDEVDDVARRLGNPWVLAIDIMNRGRTAAVQGDLAGAAAHFTEAGAYFRNLRDRAFYYSSRSELAHVLRRGGRHAEATGLYRETLPIWLELGHRGAAAHELESLAFIAGAQNRPAQAARLLGAAAALREVSGTAMSPPERGEYEQALAQLQAQIEPAAFVTAWAAGAALDLEQILAYALEA